jgi:nucleoside-diphosphate-sugar epimerase
MKILIAGASGAIGRPLIHFLVQSGHEVYGMTQSKERAHVIVEKGAKPVVLNVLEREAVFAVLADLKPEIVIDMLTSLPKEYTPEAMRQAAEMDSKIRLEGGANLQAAAEMQGVKRYIAQSTGFYYEPGDGLADETVSFAFKASPGVAAGSRVYAAIENRVLHSTKMEGVALRFGFFYGPGTWFHPGANVAQQIHKQQFPLVGQGEGIWNFVHIEDAAKAISQALKGSPGTYNIVGDNPSAMREWLPAFARYLGAVQPPQISEIEGLQQKGADFVYYATKLRGASNAKAKQELQFQPRALEWLATT